MACSKLIEVPLEQIQGLHPKSQQWLVRAAFPPVKAISWKYPQHLHDLLQTYPLHVGKTKSGYNCLGNIQLWRLAQELLAGTERIPAILHESPGTRLIEAWLRAGLCFAPATFSIKRRDLPQVYLAYLRTHPDDRECLIRAGQEFIALYPTTKGQLASLGAKEGMV